MDSRREKGVHELGSKTDARPPIVPMNRYKGLLLWVGVALPVLVLVLLSNRTNYIPKYKILDGDGTLYGNEKLTFEVVTDDKYYYAARKEHVVCVGWLEDAASLSPREAFRRLSEERFHDNKGRSPEATLCVSGMLGGVFSGKHSGQRGGPFTCNDAFEVSGKRHEGNRLFFDVRYLHFFSYDTVPDPGMVYFKLLLDELPDDIDTVVIHFREQREGIPKYFEYSEPLPQPPLSDIEINVVELKN